MTQTIFEPEATPLATRPARELAPAPVNLQTMAGLLTIAVEKGLSPEAMERLVNLQQRLMQQQAEEAFNIAIQRFQSACPVITKNATADAGHGSAARYLHGSSHRRPFSDLDLRSEDRRPVSDVSASQVGLDADLLPAIRADAGAGPDYGRHGRRRARHHDAVAAAWA
jgi:hypothetical protein